MIKAQWVPDKEAPESMNFMGRVKFRNRGPYVVVTDPKIIEKMEGIDEFKYKKVTAKEIKKNGDEGTGKK